MKKYRSGRSRTPLLMRITKPKIVLMMFLMVFWDIKQGTQASSNSLSYPRLRAARSQNEDMMNTIEQSPVGSPPLALVMDDTAIEPYMGNTQVREIREPRKKKQECGPPNIASRGFMGPTLKRSYFAYTPEEVEEKVQEERLRRKREVKRNEISEGSLPWTCETKYEWKDMGAEHYPRFVRTAECKARLCFNGFFRCRPRRYKTKILKRLSGADTSSCEEDDVSLPETLRSSYRMITVTINLCCDCTGRIPGAAEV